MNKNIPANRGKMFIWKKNVPPKRDAGFMKAVSLLGEMTYFHINRFWFFNGILLSGEISLSRGPHFAGMFFLHVNTPLLLTNKRTWFYLVRNYLVKDYNLV